MPTVATSTDVTNQQQACFGCPRHAPELWGSKEASPVLATNLLSQPPTWSQQELSSCNAPPSQPSSYHQQQHQQQFSSSQQTRQHDDDQQLLPSSANQQQQQLITRRSFELPDGAAGSKWLDVTHEPAEARFVELWGSQLVGQGQTSGEYYACDAAAADAMRRTAEELHRMFHQATEFVLREENEHLLTQRFGIAPAHVPLMRASWQSTKALPNHGSVCGRFDFGWAGGVAPFKVYEYNADCAAALVECAVIQGKFARAVGLGDMGISSGADVEASLVAAWSALRSYLQRAGHQRDAGTSGTFAHHQRDKYSSDTSAGRQRDVDTRDTSAGHQRDDDTSDVSAGRQWDVDGGGTSAGRRKPDLPHCNRSAAAVPRLQDAKGTSLVSRPLSCSVSRPLSRPRIHFLYDAAESSGEEGMTALYMQRVATQAGFDVKMVPSFDHLRLVRSTATTSSATAAPPAPAAAAAAATSTAAAAATVAAAVAAAGVAVAGAAAATTDYVIKDLDGEDVRTVWKLWSWETILAEENAGRTTFPYSGSTAASYVGGTASPYVGETAAAAAAVQARTGAASSNLSEGAAVPSLQQVFLHPDILVVEPLWRAIPSNKAILPVLWSLFPGHPNLPRAEYTLTPELQASGYARKAVNGRCGKNIAIFGPVPTSTPTSNRPASDCPASDGPTSSVTSVHSSPVSTAASKRPTSSPASDCPTSSPANDHSTRRRASCSVSVCPSPASSLTGPIVEGSGGSSSSCNSSSDDDLGDQCRRRCTKSRVTCGVRALMRLQLLKSGASGAVPTVAKAGPGRTKVLAATKGVRPSETAPTDEQAGQAGQGGGTLAAGVAQAAASAAPIVQTHGPYSSELVVYQELVDVQSFRGFFPTFSPWVAGGACGGFVVRDEASRLVEGHSAITACRVL